MRNICNEQKPKRILRRANNYVRILNLQGCKYNEDKLEKISGYSKRIFLTTYYYWAFHDETLNIAYGELIREEFYNK